VKRSLYYHTKDIRSEVFIPLLLINPYFRFSVKHVGVSHVAQV